MSRIPPHLAQVKKALALGTYVTKKMSLDEVFEKIDGFKANLAAKPGSGQNALRWMVAGLFDDDAEFYEYVMEKDSYDIEDDPEWFKVCEAAAETLLHEYEKARG